MLRRTDEHVDTPIPAVPFSSFEANSMIYSSLKADERAIAALNIPTATVSTSSASNGECHEEQLVGTVPIAFEAQINNAIQSLDCKVVKIGQ